MSQEETRFRRFPLACCQISELNCSKAPLNRRSSATILSNICLIAAPILAPNLPISGNTAEYHATGSSIKNPVFMRVCGHFEARRTTRYDPNVITPKRKASGSNPLRRTNPAAILMIAAGFFGVPPVAQTHLDKPSVGGDALIAPHTAQRCHSEPVLTLGCA